MRYSTILSGLALLSAIASAIPSSVGESVGLVPRDEKCPDCPPDKSGCKVGCIYIKCSDKKCCKSLGLQDNKPQIISYDNPLGGNIPNVHLNPIGTSTTFTWCPSDDLLLDIRGHPLGFFVNDNNELNLVTPGSGVTTQTFDVGLSPTDPGLIEVDIGPSSHSRQFFVCTENGVLSIHQGPNAASQDPFESCCPVELHFSTDIDQK